MLSCADIPEENAEWAANMLAECEYQIKRLRNRPCIAYWNGGNERPGCFGKWELTHGGNFVDVTLRGLVHNVDGTRPYANQCPTSLSDMAGDWESGDTHASSYDAGLGNVENYRKALLEKTPAFISESVTMGPGLPETYEKIFPPEKRWPLNEYWTDRFTHNPHGLNTSPFAEQEAQYVCALYGEARSLRDFCFKGMQAQAECIRAEAEYCRSIKGINSGFLNWMYSDIWPCGTCAVVDWYAEPKQAYYQLKRSFAPVLVTFTMDAEGRHNAYIVNDTYGELAGEIEYGQMLPDGKILWAERQKTAVQKHGVTRVINGKTQNLANAYLYAKAVLNGNEYSAVYSPGMWRGVEFESDYSYDVKQFAPNELRVTVRANQFAKSVFLSLPDNSGYEYSDNFVDIEAGESREIVISAFSGTVNPAGLTVTDFAKETAARKQSGNIR
jgi:beta-mannosidase